MFHGCFGLSAREYRVFGGACGLGWQCGSLGRHRYEFAAHACVLKHNALPCPQLQIDGISIRFDFRFVTYFRFQTLVRASSIHQIFCFSAETSPSYQHSYMYRIVVCGLSSPSKINKQGLCYIWASQYGRTSQYIVKFLK